MRVQPIWSGRLSAGALRIAVCLPQVPFAHGGAEILASNLVSELTRRGHDVALVTVPFRWYPDRQLLENMLVWRLLRLDRGDRPPDVVIGTKFPSYLVRHPRKVVWLFHQLRQAYDMHGTEFAQFGDDPHGAAMRQAIRKADHVALSEATAVLTISANTAERLRTFNGIDAEVCYPPAQLAGLRSIGDDGSVLSVGRLDPAKRTDLLIRAIARVPDGRATIVGEGGDRPRLERIAADLGVADRVSFVGRIDDQALRQAYGRCRCVYFAPVDEDFGMVTIEAHSAAKPVLTTTDAGGVLEFVQDGRTGLVVAPDILALGSGLARLLSDADLARRLGEAGQGAARALGWDHVVERLLAAAG